MLTEGTSMYSALSIYGFAFNIIIIYAIDIQFFGYVARIVNVCFIKSMLLGSQMIIWSFCSPP